jgi:hypothetical protein
LRVATKAKPAAASKMTRIASRNKVALGGRATQKIVSQEGLWATLRSSIFSFSLYG